MDCREMECEDWERVSCLWIRYSVWILLTHWLECKDFLTRKISTTQEEKLCNDVRRWSWRWTEELFRQGTSFFVLLQTLPIRTDKTKPSAMNQTDILRIINAIANLAAATYGIFKWILRRNVLWIWELRSGRSVGCSCRCDETCGAVIGTVGCELSW